MCPSPKGRGNHVGQQAFLFGGRGGQGPRTTLSFGQTVEFPLAADRPLMPIGPHRRRPRQTAAQFPFTPTSHQAENPCQGGQLPQAVDGPVRELAGKGLRDHDHVRHNLPAGQRGSRGVRLGEFDQQPPSDPGRPASRGTPSGPRRPAAGWKGWSSALTLLPAKPLRRQRSTGGRPRRRSPGAGHRGSRAR